MPGAGGVAGAAGEGEVEPAVLLMPSSVLAYSCSRDFPKGLRLWAVAAHPAVAAGVVVQLGLRVVVGSGRVRAAAPGPDVRARAVREGLLHRGRPRVSVQPQ